MNVEVKPPEKKKRKKTTAKKSSSPPPPPHPSFSLLPDEITVNCLARIPRSYYPNLSIVSKTFHSLLSSTELNAARSHLVNTEECLYVCLYDPRRDFPQWYTLWINPNRILTKKTTGQLLVPIPSPNFASTAKPIVVGSEIYVIGGPIDDYAPSSSVWVLDCRSHIWRDAPSMNVARKNAFICVCDSKIYVIGGVKYEELFAEVFDTRTQTWECLSEPDTEIRNRSIHTIAEKDGKINFGELSKMYGYDTKQGKWECCVDIPGTIARSEIVIGNKCYHFSRNSFEWRDINGGYPKEVKGLDSLRGIYMRNGGSDYNTRIEASCGGKWYVMWEGRVRRNCNHKKIWCAEISLEKRDGDEIWGNVEWVDVVLTVHKSCSLLHFVAASV